MNFGARLVATVSDFGAYMGELNLETLSAQVHAKNPGPDDAFQAWTVLRAELARWAQSYTQLLESLQKANAGMAVEQIALLITQYANWCDQTGTDAYGPLPNSR